MTQGRPPKPTHLRSIDGGADKAAAQPGAPASETVAIELPECPEDLDDDARAEWQRAGEELKAAGLMAKMYAGPFRGYCVAYARMVQIERKLAELQKEHGVGSLLINTPNGYPQLSPLYIAHGRERIAMLKFAQEFGMTPSSLTRATRSAQLDLFDALDAFLAGGGSQQRA
ncbi:MAG: P27 family phage terminase small subunit [Acetobacterales bacterium]